MATEHHPMTESTQWLLATSNLVFMGLFTAELLLRLLALGPHEYFQGIRGVFDLLLVLVGLLDLAVADVQGLSLLRVLRPLRLLRLERWWPDLRLLLRSVWVCVGGVGGGVGPCGGGLGPCGGGGGGPAGVLVPVQPEWLAALRGGLPGGRL
ncbi:sodium channel protein type 9 subunit alpha-like [Menidia menidia]